MGGASASVRCFKCGEQGHCAKGYTNKVLRCFKYGKTGHHAPECKNEGPTCFNYDEQGHISTQCREPKKDTTTTTYTNGRVFTLSGLEDSKKDNLIRGTYFIYNVELVAIIDTDAT